MLCPLIACSCLIYLTATLRPATSKHVCCMPLAKSCHQAQEFLGEVPQSSGAPAFAALSASTALATADDNVLPVEVLQHRPGVEAGNYAPTTGICSYRYLTHWSVSKIIIIIILARELCSSAQPRCASRTSSTTRRSCQGELLFESGGGVIFWVFSLAWGRQPARIPQLLEVETLRELMP